nr:beta-N-acetylhexosaminidase [uncultured Lachnoclostridium sp.]
MRLKITGTEDRKGGLQIQPICDILSERGHETAKDGMEGDLCIHFTRADEKGYSIAKAGRDVYISWHTLPEAFRALGKALEHAGKEKWREESKGTQGNTGLMFDCSRNGVLKVEAVKEMIRQAALMGLNWLLLYTEDTYEVEGYPCFGALRGRYTKEEIRECDAYAAQFGIEMIPCIQTLAHLRTALRWPAMEKYRDDADILLAEEERTYRLIDAMLASVKDMYRSKRVHLGMDEAFYLGYGNYRRIHGEVKQGELIRRHLDRVMEICEKYGMEPMIWSDMFFVTPGGGDYYNVPADYEWPDSEKPDRRVTLVYWDYEGHDEDRYTRMATLHKKLTDQVCFAGGAWIWNGLAPNYAQAMDATKKAFLGLEDTGVTDSFCTLWLDNGAETPMRAGLPMAAFYSRCAYGESTDPEEMESWFKMLCGESYQDMLLLDRLDHIPGTGVYNEGFANPSKQIFYQDPLTGVFDGQYAGTGLDAYYAETAGLLKKAQKRAGKLEKLFRYYRLLASVDAGKCELGEKIRGAYLSGDRAALARIAEKEMPDLRKKVQKMHALREQMWQEEFKPNGYEVMDVRMAGVEIRLKSARRRILDYLDGKIPSLEELEEERLPYFTNGEETNVSGKCNLWENIVSAANICGV